MGLVYNTFFPKKRDNAMAYSAIVVFPAAVCAVIRTLLSFWMA
jgi:hypothetical protein